MLLGEVKEWLIIDHDQDDVLLGRLMLAVTSACQNRTKQLFCEHTVTVVAEVNTPVFYLPRLPFRSLTSVHRIEADGSEIALTDEYTMLPAEDGIQFNATGKFKIVYEAGYTNENPIPEDIRLAGFSEMAYRYENRGDLTMQPGLCATAVQYLTPYINTHYYV